MSPVVCAGEQKCLATGRSAFFVTEPASSFANERQSAYTTSNNVNEVTCSTTGSPSSISENR